MCGDAAAGQLETLVASAGGQPVTHVAVSSCSGVVFEIRLNHDNPVPDGLVARGEIKARLE